MSFSLPLLGVGFVLALAQVLAAVPWMVVFNWESLRSAFVPGSLLGGGRMWRLIGQAALVALVIAIVIASLLALGIVQDRESLETLGRLYGSILHLQLLADLLVLFFGFVLLVWPKGGAVALAAFREGVRQPMFWL